MPGSQKLRLLTIVGLTAMLASICAYGTMAFDWFRFFDRPVASVSIEGEFRVLTKSQLTRLISPLVSGSFFRLDLQAIKTHIEMEPYVEYAVVSRTWPDRVRVRVFEEKPIARWGKHSFLNHRGKIINSHNTLRLEHLPILFSEGVDGNQSSFVMVYYQQLTTLLQPHGLSIAELSQSRHDGWRLQLTNGLSLLLGQEGVKKKVQRFLKVYSHHLQSHIDEIAWVDVRYRNGVAVRWRKDVCVKAVCDFLTIN